MLTGELRQQRVELAGGLLRVLQGQQRIGFRDIVTGDESWFLHHYDHWQIWRVSADEVSTIVVHMITAAQTMLTVFLSINSAIFINSLPPGEKFNSGHFCEKMLEPPSEIVHSRYAAYSARPILHFDNATPH
jgi:hypothetical protein